MIWFWRSSRTTAMGRYALPRVSKSSRENETGQNETGQNRSHRIYNIALYYNHVLPSLRKAPQSPKAASRMFLSFDDAVHVTHQLL